MGGQDRKRVTQGKLLERVARSLSQHKKGTKRPSYVAGYAQIDPIPLICRFSYLVTFMAMVGQQRKLFAQRTV